MIHFVDYRQKIVYVNLRVATWILPSVPVVLFFFLNRRHLRSSHYIISNLWNQMKYKTLRTSFLRVQKTNKTCVKENVLPFLNRRWYQKTVYLNAYKKNTELSYSSPNDNYPKTNTHDSSFNQPIESQNAEFQVHIAQCEMFLQNANSQKHTHNKVFKWNWKHTHQSFNLDAYISIRTLFHCQL